MPLSGKMALVGIVLLACGIYMALSAPLAVEAGRIAVVKSGIFGLSDTVYDAGGINWVWSRLIPGDSKVFAFPEGQVLTRRTLTFMLPPGEIPGMSNTNDFFCSLELSFTWSFPRASLVPLVQNGITSQDVLAARVLDRIEPLLRHALVDETERALLAAEGRAVPELQTVSAEVIEREALPLLSEFLSAHGVKLIGLDAYWSALPDPARYVRIRDALRDADMYLAEQIREWRRAAALLDKKTHESMEEQRHLEAVAKLVTEYPKLLDYLAITKLSDKIRLALFPLTDGAAKLTLADILRLARSAPETAPSANEEPVDTAPHAKPNGGNAAQDRLFPPGTLPASE